MNGLIILEGPDGSGKSTLAKCIADRHGAYTRHMTYRWKSLPGTKHPTMFDYHTAGIHRVSKISQRRLAVLDRSWPSEKIYADCYRGGSYWPMMGRMIDRVVLKHAGIYVFCLTDPAVADARHEQLKLRRREMFDSKMGVIAKSYLDLYQSMNHRTDVVKYEIAVEGQCMESFADAVVKLALDWRGKQYQNALNPSDHNVLGHLHSAKVLFVGDKTNPKFNRIRWPFYDHSNCSLHLAGSLDRFGFDESSAMWTNANEDPWHVADILDAKPIPVIAFGDNASDALKRTGIKHSKLPHPQWARRFDHDGNYGKTVLDAVMIAQTKGACPQLSEA